jgi:hypothetical protein
MKRYPGKGGTFLRNELSKQPVDRLIVHGAVDIREAGQISWFENMQLTFD